MKKNPRATRECKRLKSLQRLEEMGIVPLLADDDYDKDEPRITVWCVAGKLVLNRDDLQHTGG